MKRRNLLYIAALIILIILLISKCNCNGNKNIVKTSIVNPPIKESDMPYTEYKVNASKGDTILYKSGTVISFPPDAFVDEKGNIIKGDVQIKYREFSKPIDFFLSGIPMDYDSAGIKYTFESAGMCEIRALKDGRPVFVNQKSTPEVNIATNNKDIAQNLYYLDTASGKWINKGKSEILELGKTSMTTTMPDIGLSTSNLVEPVRPHKVEDDLPLIKVTIDPESFKELMVYDNLYFQLDKSEANFNPNDSYTRWDDIQLQKANKHGLYNIKFSKIIYDPKFNKSVKSVSYKVHPVLDEKNYAKALQTFEKQNLKYQSELKQLQQRQAANREAYIKDSIKNRELDIANARTEKLNEYIEARNGELEAKDISMRLLRSFPIQRFGYWNCDNPLPPPAQTLPIIAVFTDKEGKQLMLRNLTVFYKERNSIYSFMDNNICVSSIGQSMIIGSENGKIAYINYDEFKKYKIVANSLTVFKMDMLPKSNDKYEQIKAMLTQ
jgi:hypothetical protein